MKRIVKNQTVERRAEGEGEGEGEEEEEEAEADLAVEIVGAAEGRRSSI